MINVVIRVETSADIDAVRNINVRAFGQPTEADIVNALRMSCRNALSLVAVEDNAVVGHILFTPVTIDGSSIAGGMGLAPMAVIPEKQRMGIGSQLVRAGLERLKQAGSPFVIVLGHPEYYPRFGFVPASRYGLSCRWQGVPDEAFMVLVLRSQYMNSIHGIVRYRPEFEIGV